MIYLCLTLLMCVGNDNLHLMTSDRRQRLRVDLTDWEGNTAYASYDNFKVGSALEKYKLASLGAYKGTAGQYDLKNGAIILSLVCMIANISDTILLHMPRVV